MAINEKKTKVLILDDEKVILDTCRTILDATDLEIVTTTSVSECFHIASFGDIGLFITDIMMPELNGVEVIRRLRKQNPRLTVVVITGYPSLSTAREVMKLGAYDYIPKPFTPEEFKKIVFEAIAKTDPRKKLRETLVLEILDRTYDDPAFFDRLYVEGGDALNEYDISPEAKSAIITGDIKWIEENAGKLNEKQKMMLVKKLSAEIW
jgi:YesN/AraC family two-component response regulator